MAKRSFYITESELDDYQWNIVQRKIDNSLVVKGSAGSGKSVLALWKAKQIQEEKKGSFYLIVYTKTLKKYIEEGIREIGLNSKNVLYFYEWKNKGKPSADYLIVDEVQDFDEEEINLFKEKAHKALFLFGDDAQQLYSFIKTSLSMESIADIIGYSIENLTFNHRLPKKIARFAEHLLTRRDDLEVRCRFEGVEKPKILKYETFYKQLDAIMEIIKAREYDDVGIFFNTNRDVEKAYKYFNSKNFKVEAKFDSYIIAGHFGTTINLDFSSNLPKLMTYHSSKGLQFEAVFLPDCEDKKEKKPNRNAIYVAITRSYRDLFIMYSDELLSYFNEITKDLYETSLATEDDIDW